MKVDLAEVKPLDKEGLSAFLRAKPDIPTVAFVDLVKESGGDLWSLCHRLVASLDVEKRPDRHMVIIDNVDGFEAFVGELNAFGQRATVRSRIMQTFEVATKKCHVVFVSEEESAGATVLMDVSDVVVQLKVAQSVGYRTRALEVIKARAQPISRGEHHFLIRTGGGSTTAMQENADDPRCTNAYVLVVPSFSTISRRIMHEPGEPISEPAIDGRAGFGVAGLDELCGRSKGVESSPLLRDTVGVEYGAITAILGDPNTHKTPLAHKFIRRPFELFALNLIELYKECRYANEPWGHRLQKLEKLIESETDEVGQAEDLNTQIAQKLYKGRPGEEELWSVEAIEKEVKESIKRSKLTTGLTIILCEHWVRSLKKRLQRMLLDGIDTELLMRCLPPEPAIASHPLLAQFLKGVSVKETELIEAVFDYWWHRMTQDHSGAPADLELRELYLQSSEEKPRVDIVQAASKGRAREYKPEMEVQRKQKLEVQRKDHREKVRSMNILDVLETMFAGSTLLLNQEESRGLCHPATADDLDRRIATKLIVGYAIYYVQRMLDEDRANLNKLSEKFLSSETAATWQEPVTAARLKEALEKLEELENLEHLVTAPRSRSIGKRVSPRELRWTENRISECDFSDFARFLFEASPRTHPFALTHGEQQLRLELERIPSEGEPAVLLSVFVAMVLELARTGHISIEGHVDDELNARRLATQKREKLREWLDKHVEPPGKDGPTERPLRATLRRLALAIGGAVSSSQEFQECIRDLIREYAKARFLYREGPAWSPRDKLSMLRCALEDAVRAGQLDGPAILVTTTPQVNLESIWKPHHAWLIQRLKRGGFQSDEIAIFEEVLKDHMRCWLIVRRLEVHFLSSPTLAAIMRRSVESALQILFARPGPTAVETADTTNWETQVSLRIKKSWAIRFVLDGLGSLRQTYPPVANDPLFLPSLKFYLEREGITSVIVASQPGRPDAVESDPFHRDSVNFFVRQIRTWRVFFYGSLGVAITHIPSAIKGAREAVRELRLNRFGEIDIDPHYELYRGLESGHPQRVPLEIRLLGDMPGFVHYRDELNKLFSGLFPASSNQEVVRAETGADWTESIKDFGRLHRNMRGLDHTLILQMDDFWSFRRPDGMRDLSPYLNAVTRSEDDGEHDNDPLEIFQPTLADPTALRAPKRADRFHWNGYHLGSGGSKPPENVAVDRIPFTWDFGFLLCDRFWWDKASRARLEHFQKSLDPGHEANVEVQHVWSELQKARPSDQKRAASPKLSSDQKRAASPELPIWMPPLSSWRFFLEGAVSVARYRALSDENSGPAFDIRIMGGESLMCLILEIWASEVYWKYRQKPGGPRDANEVRRWYFSRYTRRSFSPTPTKGLVGLISEPKVRGSLKEIFANAVSRGRLPDLYRHSLELFKSILLLRESMSFGEFCNPADPFEVKQKPVHPNAISARHWYTTACAFMEEPANRDRFLPVRLPGHFSVRGDWYLAVAKGSYSNQLADRALDLLSSSRGNIERLHRGLGLPVRDIGDLTTGADPRTPLTYIGEDGRRRFVRYSALSRLGATEQDSDFNWLWRSTLGDYDAQNRAFHQGVAALLHWWSQLQQLRTAQWRNGFELYDALNRYEFADENGKAKLFDEYFAVTSLWEFPEICDEIIDRLRRATPRHQSG